MGGHTTFVFNRGGVFILETLKIFKIGKIALKYEAISSVPGVVLRSNFARLVKGKIHINSGGQKVKRSSHFENYFCLGKHFFLSRTPYFRFLEGYQAQTL